MKCCCVWILRVIVQCQTAEQVDDARCEKAARGQRVCFASTQSTPLAGGSGLLNMVLWSDKSDDEILKHHSSYIVHVEQQIVSKSDKLTSPVWKHPLSCEFKEITEMEQKHRAVLYCFSQSSITGWTAHIHVQLGFLLCTNTKTLNKTLCCIKKNSTKLRN